MGEVLRLFPVIPSRFPTVVEALRFFSRPGAIDLLENVLAPPVDWTNDSVVDTYTAAVFRHLVGEHYATQRLFYLAGQVAANERHFDRLTAEGNTGAAVTHDCIAAILREWADRIHQDACGTPPPGPRAA